MFLIFVNGLPNVFEALELLIADDVEMVARRARAISIQRPRITIWDWSGKWDLPTNPAK